MKDLKPAAAEAPTAPNSPDMGRHPGPFTLGPSRPARRSGRRTGKITGGHVDERPYRGIGLSCRFRARTVPADHAPELVDEIEERLRRANGRGTTGSISGCGLSFNDAAPEIRTIVVAAPQPIIRLIFHLPVKPVTLVVPPTYQYSVQLEKAERLLKKCLKNAPLPGDPSPSLEAVGRPERPGRLRPEQHLLCEKPGQLSPVWHSGYSLGKKIPGRGHLMVRCSRCPGLPASARRARSKKRISCSAPIAA